MPVELEKSYNSGLVEAKWYSFWEQKGYFTADNQSTRPRFSIVIPPPNVTGSLHMGHALQHTLHDILVRWKRMSGFNTLWLPGTDHASIGVHYVLDKQLEAEKQTRFDLGRDRFLERAWKWKESSGGTILAQMRRMGVSCDWSRERFTMDEGLSRAVQEVFVRLYEEGLIYRGEYIVNWCPRCKTAISDLEVVYEATPGKLWHLKYPIRGEAGHIVVATTRPETMLGDTAVAVHPDDERFRSLVGKTAVLPVLGREIPIIADEFVDREFGTGVVKVTPAHDPKDYEAGIRHNLPRIAVIGDDGIMTAEAGPCAGMDRFACRAWLVERLEHQGLVAKTEDHEHNVGQCDRCSTVVEPKISLQWYLRIAPLAAPAIEAVESGKTQFVPENFKNRYFEWMYNIHDWCISRQLWWGHRIPAWYCDPCGEVIVSRTTPSKCPRCDGASLREETDILDTWFSSALWPFSTLGWPERTRDLAVFYPTDVLITGPDIIFFWVARMMMMGLKFMGEVPFFKVHINGIVRDAQRKKMSKTRGNVIEPLELVDQYGADAVRFTLSSMAVPGTDIPFSSDRMKGYSAFANKIWNAARFLLMKLREGERGLTHAELEQVLSARRLMLALEDRWLLHRLNRLTEETSEALGKFRFHDASSLIYQFFWHEFCDWYIEFCKPFLDGSAEPEERRIRTGVLIHVMDQALKILHPFMPFITEEIWQKIPHEGESIMVQPFPQSREAFNDPDASASMEALMELIGALRSTRSELNIARNDLTVLFVPATATMREVIAGNLENLKRLARVRGLEFVELLPPDRTLLKGVCNAGEFGLDLAGSLDFGVERERLNKELARLDADIEKIARKLENHDFVLRAPESVVAENRTRHAELIQKRAKLASSLARLATP